MKKWNINFIYPKGLTGPSGIPGISGIRNNKVRSFIIKRILCKI